MTHPFAHVPPRRRPLLLGILLIASAGLAATLSAQGIPLRTAAAPGGVLSYEFAWTGARAAEILRSWAPMREIARQQLLIDFPYLLAYPLLLSLACVLLAGTGPGGWARAGRFLAWAVLPAGLLDGIENAALLRMLEHGAADAPARVAGVCASLKFFLVGCAVAYVLAQGGRLLAGRLSGRGRSARRSSR
ncbi:MAG TPA: hypothetical protein VFX98_07025 [Longimicrobiaceae bacterium]|nr:hypothetical protein [Longimicrobiaceae bacterium]